MKKSLLTLLLAAAVLPVAAQDTLTLPITPSPTYWPENTCWMQDNPSASHLSVSKYSQSVTIYEAFGYRNLKSPLRIVGLAGIRDTHALDSQPSGPENMAARVPEYFLLFQPRPDTLELLKRVCYTDVDPRCKIKLHARISGRTGIYWQYPDLYEVYFDDTVTVQDSFYIGYTYYNGIPPQIGAIRPVKTASYWMGSNGYYESDSLRVIALCNDLTFWPPYMVRLSPGIFPIIDTTGMFADTTQGGDTTIVDTTIVDTTSISAVADRFTHLMPNPATDQATVYSSFPMRSVAIYDPTGRRVMHRRVDDRTLQLDLTGYAKGTYLVVILTPAGRSVKRLLVQ